MRKKVTPEEKDQIWKFYKEFRENPILLRLYQTKQHRSSNTFRHVCLVAKESIRFAMRHRLDVDYHSLIRGGFLHDLFFYDWRKCPEKKAKHLIRHPREAFDNAIKYFNLTPAEVDIIINHMWPVTISKFPKTLEGKIVSLMDKKVCIMEVFSKKTAMLIFDLDGTLIDSIPDIQAAANFALTKNQLPPKSYDDIRLAIGNGAPTLLRRLVPAGTPEPLAEKVYQDYLTYYAEHPFDLTKPYPGMVKTLKKLKRHGYLLGLATNKNEKVAKMIVDKFFPHFFNCVQGSNTIIPHKPDPKMIEAIIDDIGMKKKRRIIYIGDTEIDYAAAKNAGIKFLASAYGYRTKQEIEEKLNPLQKMVIDYVERPLAILDYFKIYYRE